MSEIVFASSDTQESRRISQRVKAGELRTLLPRVYTSNLTDTPEQIVRRNLALILGQLYPDALISHRSALEGGSLAGSSRTRRRAGHRGGRRDGRTPSRPR